MNSFGLNSAALNAGVVSALLGTALMTAGVSFTANPTLTTYAAPITVSSTAQVEADGLRTASGLVHPISSTLNAYADSVIAISASASTSTVLNVRARFTDVYAQLTSGMTASGTKIQGGGNAPAVTAFSASITGLRIAQLEGTCSISPWIYANPSVKRSGQNTTERDGYVRPWATTTGTTANGLRTAYPTVAAELASTVSLGDATKMHGARATAASSLDFYAVPSSDVVHFSLQKNLLTAIGRHTHAARATATVASDGTADPLLLTQGRAQTAGSNSDFTADGRLAQRTTADMSPRFSTYAMPRIAELGRATATASFSTTAEPWTYRASSAQVDLTSAGAAIGTRNTFGAATSSSEIRLYALGIANPATRAPADRTMQIQFASRLMPIPYQNRTMRTT